MHNCWLWAPPPRFFFTDLMSSVEWITIFLCDGVSFEGSCLCSSPAQFRAIWNSPQTVCISEESCLFLLTAFLWSLFWDCVETIGGLNYLTMASDSLVCLGTESLDLFSTFSLEILSSLSFMTPLFNSLDGGRFITTGTFLFPGKSTSFFLS